MTKNDYLNLKQNDGKLQIMHIYHNENIGLANLTFDEFRNSLNSFIKKEATETGVNENKIFTDMFNKALDYFDAKYQIVYI